MTDYEISPNDPLPAQYLPAFLSLWGDEGMHLAMLKGNEHAVNDNLN